MKLNWDDVKFNVEKLYPAFELYVKKRGFVSKPSLADIKLWYEFLEFVFERVKDEI